MHGIAVFPSVLGGELCQCRAARESGAARSVVRRTLRVLRYPRVQFHRLGGTAGVGLLDLGLDLVLVGFRVGPHPGLPGLLGYVERDQAQQSAELARGIGVTGLGGGP
ncbi:hypothetical protein [Streptomyces sp. NPDC002851]